MKETPIGTVFEIAVPETGLAYAQLTHWDPSLAAIVWVLDGVWPRRPNDLSELVSRADGYFSYCLLELLARSGHASAIGEYEVPDARRSFPVFRDYLHVNTRGRSFGHRLWYGSKSRAVGDSLSTEQAKLPLRSVPSTDLFLRRLAQGWRPELHQDLVIEARRQKGKETHDPQTDRVGVTTHYLYFSDEAAATHAAQRVRDLGGEVKVQKSASVADNWLLLATLPPEWTREAAELEFERLATDQKGLYDGAETEIY